MPTNKRVPPILYSPQYGLVRRVAAQSIPNNAITVLQFDTVVQTNDISWDATNFWFVTPETGIYLLNGFYQTAVPIANLTRQVLFYINGALTYSRNPISNLNQVGGNVEDLTAIADLNAGDTVQMRVFQNSGAALNTAVVGKMSQFAVIRISNA